jgi:GNAT superfamily N-acetyltransferase
MLDNEGVTGKELAAALPDIPRWVETRAILLSSRCKLYVEDESAWKTSDLPSDIPAPFPGNFVIRSPQFPLMSILGCPLENTIRSAISEMTEPFEILTPPENEAYVAATLPNWIGQSATIHALHALNAVPADHVRILDDISDLNPAPVPAKLRKELKRAYYISPIAAAYEDEIPVSFCYAGAMTETLWDISVDTLADYRGRGYAQEAVVYMIEYMRKIGKEPVYGAMDSNLPSLRLAEKLGFVPVDRLFVFAGPKA